MSKKGITRKQRLFCYYYIQSENAYRSALRAGYSVTTAKNAVSEILERTGVRTYLNHQFNSVFKRESRRNLTIKNVIDNLLNIGAGLPIKRHYKKIDHNNPNKSEDVTIIGPAPLRDQVNAGATLIGLKNDLSKSKAKLFKARTQLVKSRLPSYESQQKPRPLFLDSVIEYHRRHENDLRDNSED